MQNRKVYISGDLVPDNEAKISIYDSAVLLGDTVTESTRTFNYKPFKLIEHVERLYKSLKLTRIDPGMTKDEMIEVSENLLAVNKETYGDDEDNQLRVAYGNNGKLDITNKTNGYINYEFDRDDKKTTINISINGVTTEISDEEVISTYISYI